MTSVLVLGADGMLGSMLARVLSTDPALSVVRCTRVGAQNDLQFDANRDSVDELIDRTRCDWIVNAIGVLAPLIDETDPGSVASAIHVNSTFPHLLAAAAGRDSRVIHITSDGVFSGRSAPYDERAPHDAAGVYGRSKSLGESRSTNCINLRCSIIGPEKPPAKSLLGTILSQPPGAVMTGYTNHRWNGITTLHLAKLCVAVINDGGHPHRSDLHVVPSDAVSKAELISLCALAFGRTDLTVETAPAPEPVDRTLRTLYPEINQRLWNAAGHTVPPTIGEMVWELASSHHN